MSTPATIPMLSPPDEQGNPGTWGPVPLTQVSRARSLGGVVGINVKGPDGTVAPVRADRVHEAVANGGQIVPIGSGAPPAPQEGGWGAYLHDLAGVPAGLVNMAQMVGEGMSGVPGPAIQQAGVNAYNQNASEKAAGYSLPYRVAAGIAAQAGTNVGGMEQAAREGDPGAVLGHAAAGATLASAPLIGEGLARGANEIIPSTTRAGQGIGILRDQLNAQPVKGKLASYQLGSDLLDKWDKTGTPVPPQLRAYVENVTDAGASGRALTFQDLWEHREALNDLKYAQALPGKAARQIGQVASGLTDEMQTLANRAGMGKDWAAQQKEYARGQQVMRVANKIGPAVGAAAGGYLGRGAGTLATSEAAGLGAAAGKYVGNPVIGGLTRAIIERDAGAPTLSQVPTAPSAPAVKPFNEYTPSDIEALRQQNIARMRQTDPTAFTRPTNPFDATPGSMDAVNADPWMRRAMDQGGPPRAPEVWPDAYRNAQQGFTNTGGGGANYSAADLAALKARNGITDVPKPTSATQPIGKLSPAEYQRVLLRAKDGEISPGKADTLINRLGGSVRVKPLPRPPE